MLQVKFFMNLNFFFFKAELAKMDSGCGGVDWKQDERVLAIAAYHIEKVGRADTYSHTSQLCPT